WVAQVSPDGKSIVAASACVFVPRFSRLLPSSGTGLEFPRYVDSADRSILLSLTQQSAAGPWRLQGSVGAGVLSQVVPTGRAFRQSLQAAAGNRPLRLAGPARRLTFVWEMLPDGDQRLSWEGRESLDVIPDVEPPMYVDAGLSEVGRIDLPFGSDVLREF